ncbi:cation:proton antiporter family protein [Granulosicoccus antarcticus]|uniref:Glutathione-regulated potassium-efflux system protein KefC n=1 Tax=Granulosicoccus antarcticus IMCC3135 TaxID=1192854 RepID=A0A2Z2NR90_9GAMM|nr:cation:proton antiporter family protein [Granulosicoccus antarcticus]ASJ72521.1 Glutathione-regulated potassium-efflux system protein KefC [Granulosicoccus antarcticus IMCC3135]
MEPLVVALAFLLGLGFRKLGYPPLLGYLMAGFIGNATGYGSAEALAPLADAGILLLLFTIGLKLNPRDLKPRYVWASALLHMLIAVPLTAVVIYLIGSVYEPLSFVHGAGPLTLAFALSFSSTVLAIKLFEERGETASFYASIAIGILVVQDVLAVVYLVATSGHWPDPWALILLALPLFIPVFKRLLGMIGHGELLLLAGIVFAFGAAELFQLLGLKAGLGGLVMGMLLARASPGKSKELYDQLLGLKNLLLIGFFLQIGYYGIPRLELVYIAIVLGLLITLRPVIYFCLLTAFGLRARTGWFAGLALFNYSEFGLIVAAIAQQAGILREQWLVTLALSMAISYVFAIPLNRKAHELYIRYSDVLQRFEKPSRLPEEIIGSLGGANIAILGMGRVGRAAYDTLREAGHDKVVGVEESYALTLELTQSGWPCVHGDASDRDFWERTGLANCELILVSLSNHREHVRIARLARELGFEKTIAVATRFPDESVELEALGCVTFYRYQDVGREFARHTLSACSELAEQPSLDR